MLQKKSSARAQCLQHCGIPHGTRAQTAVRFALTNADISSAIVGLATLDHLAEAMAGADAGPLPAEAQAALERVYASGFDHAG